MVTLASLAAATIVGCTDVDPYEVQCRELVNSPDRLREVTLQLADKNVQKKVEYESQILRVCADAPEDFRPVQQIEPEN